MWRRASRLSQGPHNGHPRSYSRCDSQCAARTTGGPAPPVVKAMRVPSRLAQNGHAATLSPYRAGGAIQSDTIGKSACLASEDSRARIEDIVGVEPPLGGSEPRP